MMNSNALLRRMARSDFGSGPFPADGVREAFHPEELTLNDVRLPTTLVSWTAHPWAAGCPASAAPITPTQYFAAKLDASMNAVEVFREVHDAVTDPERTRISAILEDRYWGPLNQWTLHPLVAAAARWDFQQRTLGVFRTAGLAFREMRDGTDLQKIRDLHLKHRGQVAEPCAMGKLSPEAAAVTAFVLDYFFLQVLVARDLQRLRRGGPNLGELAFQAVADEEHPSEFRRGLEHLSAARSFLKVCGDTGSDEVGAAATVPPVETILPEYPYLG